MIVLVCGTLVLGDIGTLFPSLLFTGVAGFLLLAVEALAHDLDNPFHDNHGTGTDTVGVHALHVVAEKYRLRTRGAKTKHER
jgi:predicted membrane chloride channel (bestrophin family)